MKNSAKILMVICAFIANFMFQGCATFPKHYKEAVEPIADGNQLKINGHYKIIPVPFAEDNRAYAYDSLNIRFNSAFQKFYRDNEGRGSRDTMKVGNLEDYSFKLDADNGKLYVTYLKNGSEFRKLTYDYKMIGGRYLLIKNKNVKVQGIPYLLGGFDVKRRRLATDGQNLVIEESHHSSGALLFIFGDSKVWTNRYKYMRIDCDN